MVCIINPDFWEWVILTCWLHAFHLPPCLLILVGCWDPSALSVFQTTKLWAYLDSLIKSLFLRLLCSPKGFSSRQPTFIKDFVENTWDKLNWAAPVQNSNACSVRTRCKAVGVLGIVNHHQGLQRQVHLLERAQCVTLHLSSVETGILEVIVYLSPLPSIRLLLNYT